MNWILRGSRIVATLFVCSLFQFAAAQTTVLYSFESGLDGWADGFGCDGGNRCTTGLDTIGATDGSNSFRITSIGDGFAWSAENQLDSASAQYAAIDTAAQTPFGNRLEFDVTWTDASVPPPYGFLGVSVYINNSGGFSQFDNAVNMSEAGTHTASVSLVNFSTPISSSLDGNGFYNMGFGTNGDWGSVDGSVYIDNIRLVEFNPAETADLDMDSDLDADDWALFIAGHKADLTGLTPEEQFQMGDLNGDGFNDLADFQLFENVYDAVNGASAFRDMIANVPEPSSIVLLALAGAALGLFRKSRLSGRTIMLLLAVGFASLAGSTSEAQLLHSWEDGFEGWNSTTFANNPTSLAIENSNGVTDGSSALAITQTGDGFSWNAQINWGGAASPIGSIINDAVVTGLDFFDLEFDVTYDPGVVPPPATFMNMSLAFNSDAGWSQVDGSGFYAGGGPITLSEFIPMNEFNIAANSGFYQLNIAMNGDWGAGDATIFIDNLRITQFLEPATLSLEVDRSNGATRILNDATGDSFDFDYYSITSPSNSLNVSGWDSLDAQNIDAIDGPDAGFTAGDSVLEGWDAAGGSHAGDLTEAFLLGSTTLNSGQDLSLGNAYQNLINGEDLVFQYRDTTRPDVLVNGDVVYIGEAPTITGDFDANGDYDCGDVDSLVAEIVAGTNTASFDLTADGVVNGDDLTAWLAEAGAAENASGNPYLTGDANLDGFVDVSDRNIWNANKFSNSPAWCAGDFNADGFVDISDLNIWNTFKFQQSDSVSAVPEPSSAGLILVGLVGLLAQRRNQRRS